MSPTVTCGRSPIPTTTARHLHRHLAFAVAASVGRGPNGAGRANRSERPGR